jgi:6-phosphofructokinase 2
MERIVTITLNPTVDKSTRVEKLVAEQKLKCEAPIYEPGGGGINISRALKRLGTDSISIFPSGGRTGELLQELLEEEDIGQEIVHTKNETRENFIVVETSTNQQYRFGMPGPEMLPEEIARVIPLIRKISPQWIVVSGSMPPNFDLDFLGHIASLSRELKARLIVDTSGDALTRAVDEGVYLLKPNLGELSKFTGVESLDSESADEAAMELINRGKCEVVVVSMGAMGACLVSKDIEEHIAAPAVKKLSTVGAGDSMVAGMIHALAEGRDLHEMVRLGVACGTAATMNPGTELFKLADVERLYRWLSRDLVSNSQ